MKKILLIFILSLNLFAGGTLTSDTSAYDGCSCNAGYFYDTDNINSVTTNSFIYYDTTIPSACTSISRAVTIDIVNGDPSDYKTLITSTRTTEYCIACTEPDSESPTTPPFSNRTIFMFEGRGATSPGCNVGVDTDIFNAWNLLPSEDRYLGSITVDCCTKQTLYVKADTNTSCPVGQEEFEGACYETCGVDGLVIDGSCVERGTCRTDFVGFTSIDAFGNDASCNIIEGDVVYSETYQLFPNESGASLDCCGKLIDNGGDAPIDGNTTNNSDPTILSALSALRDSNNENAQTAEEHLTTLSEDLASVENNDDENTALTNAILGDILASSTVTNNQLVNTNSHLSNIASQVATTNQVLSDLSTSQATQANQNHSDLEGIKSAIDGLASQNNDDVVNAVNTASNTAHEDAENIKDAVEGLKDGSEEAQSELDGIKGGITDATNSANLNYQSAINTFNTLLTSYSNTPPVFQGTGNHVFSTVVYGKTISLDLSMFADLRQYFDIVFILMLAWINFKIYRWVFEFLIKIGV